MIVKAETATVPPDTISAESRTKFEVAVPTLPSMTTVELSDLSALNQVAVEVNTATADVMALAAALALEALAKAVALNVRVASRFWVDTAVSAVAGCVPSYMRSLPELSRAAAASMEALRVAVAALGLRDILGAYGYRVQSVSVCVEIIYLGLGESARYDS